MRVCRHVAAGQLPQDDHEATRQPRSLWHRPWWHCPAPPPHAVPSGTSTGAQDRSAPQTSLLPLTQSSCNRVDCAEQALPGRLQLTPQRGPAQGSLRVVASFRAAQETPPLVASVQLRRDVRVPPVLPHPAPLQVDQLDHAPQLQSRGHGLTLQDCARALLRPRASHVWPPLMASWH